MHRSHLILLLAAILGIAPNAHAEFTPGEILISEMNCVACHATTPEITQRLAPRLAPKLTELRVSPQWLREFLADPQATKPGTLMPDMLHQVPIEEKAAVLEDLTHFLVAIQPSGSALKTELTPGKIEQGKKLYHEVGCVQCHAPFEAPTGKEKVAGMAEEIARLAEQSVPLAGPKITSKYSVPELAKFLQDPLKTRPAGRMPSMKLTATEAEAIAAYLLRDQTPTPDAPFVVDPSKANAGANRFVGLQCAKCHTEEPLTKFTISALTPNAPDLARMRPRQPIGCLSPIAKPRTAKYQLTDRQRTVIISGLQNQAVLTAPLTPDQEVKRAMTTLNCYACHNLDRRGGAFGIRRDYFTSNSGKDESDRIPSNLGKVGKRLQPSQLRDILETGATLRPQMNTRMPLFGKPNVGHLIEAFQKAAKSETVHPNQ